METNRTTCSDTVPEFDMRCRDIRPTHEGVDLEPIIEEIARKTMLTPAEVRQIIGIATSIGEVDTDALAGTVVEKHKERVYAASLLLENTKGEVRSQRRVNRAFAKQEKRLSFSQQLRKGYTNKNR